MVRHLFDNWAPFVTGILLGTIVGMVGAVYVGHVLMDGGIAGLAGAALTAGATAFGAIWVARYQVSAKERSSEKFVADAVASIRDEAYVLLRLVQMGPSDDLDAYGCKLLDQVQNLSEGLGLFQKNVLTSLPSNYDIKLWVNRLETAVQTNLKTIEKESKWLKGTRSQAVVDNARKDLRSTATEILQACNEAIQRFWYRKPLPTEEQVAARLGKLESFVC